SLKVKFNNAIGYFIEITKANVDKAPEHYHKRQTMTNASRYSTPELKEREEEILSAKSRQIERERVLFQELLEQLRPVLGELRQVHSFLSRLDALQSLAQLAEDDALTCPTLTDERTLSIKEGRHPVLGSLMEGQFVPNSLEMSPDNKRFLIITGPNMGGKSTYLRQAALIIIMAQVGSFVPASKAHIGVVDKVFARLGASDDMLEGESTFMVEMREAALITSAATKRSFVLIDEIGRGTATADGLALARAIVEWLTKEVQCRTLFATHFHELTSLETDLSGVHNLSVGSVDRGGKVFFTHQICGGPASRSYGIEVARLAGLPDNILTRAKQLNSSLPSSPSNGKQQLDMFSSPCEPEVRIEIQAPDDYEALQALRYEIEQIKIEETTPLEALMLLEKLSKQL
ncbi:MAG: DNA mismatch repair protein MutS, partial [Bdellovibrionales bacterium]|nr:DNA mismatch repair protein MutS [Bdellovibrionales bacterium]